MKVPYSWLKEYVNVNIEPKKMAYLLTMAGVNVESVEHIGGDALFECEITANRPDCLSVLGIAREVAAILGRKLKIPRELQGSRGHRTGKRDPDFGIDLRNTELCPRYTARVIRDVDVGPSPDWLKQRILAVGLRPVNNIVDITNFVLFETGQPMHAFDYDKIRGKIIVRQARKGENILTIDNVPRTCDDDMLVIADEAGPMAIAGIMGGLETEVNDMTKNILLESAFFNPVSIRRTSRRLGLSSESSYRFERRVSNEMVTKASDRASALIEKIAGGQKDSLLDAGNKKAYSRTIRLDLERVNRVLGVSIGKTRTLRILKAVGFSVAEDKKKTVTVMVPSFRGDVKTEIDVTEEIARIYGYEKIPLTVPHSKGHASVRDTMYVLKEKMREALTRFGLDEIITYSLENKKSIRGLGTNENEVIAIQNPLSIDQEIMRPTLLPGMLNAISHNCNRRAKRLALFEVGKTYREKSDAFIEQRVVSIGLAGVKRSDWKVHREEFDFFDLKGICEGLLGALGIDPVADEVLFRPEAMPGMEARTCAVVELGRAAIAFIGEVDPTVLKQRDIEKRVFYGELSIDKILDKARLDRRYAPLGRYPSIMRDISLVIGNEGTSDEIVGIIRDTGKELVRDVSLVDCYKGKQIPEGKRGFLYRVEYRSDERTLEDAEIEKLHTRVKDALAGRLNVSFR
jgi:phenylalanyl-tRNA synthetase beta chain